MSIKHSSDRVEELERENNRLRQELTALGGPAAITATPAVIASTAGPAVEADEDRVLGNINLAPGFVGYGWKNSLYTSMLRVLAVLSDLALQNRRFGAFEANPNPTTAHTLLKAILIPMADLIDTVKQEDAYREHCRRRTREWRNRAARGDRRARRVIRNSDRFKRNRWVGNFSEVVDTLRVGNSPSKIRMCENVQILNRLNCCFEVVEYMGKTHCVLYPARWHNAFLRARLGGNLNANCNQERAMLDETVPAGAKPKPFASDAECWHAGLRLLTLLHPLRGLGIRGEPDHERAEGLIQPSAAPSPARTVLPGGAGRR